MVKMITKQPVRTIVCALLVFILVCLFVSCSYPVEEEYHDFLLDADLVNRFEICIDRIERDKSSFYIQSELKALQGDIRSWQGENQSIQQINRQLIDCADALLAAIDHQENKEPEAAQTKIEQANTFFEEAKYHIRENNQAITNAG